jgi:hypothetical protein
MSQQIWPSTPSGIRENGIRYRKNAKKPAKRGNDQIRARDFDDDDPFSEREAIV